MDLIQQGIGWLKEGEAPEAVIEEALEQHEAATEKGARAAWLVVAAEARVATAEADDAADAASQAVAIFREMGQKACEAMAASALSSALAMKQDWEGAVAACSRELAAYKELGNKRSEAQATLKLAKARISLMKDPFEAAQTALAATKLFRAVGDRAGELAALQAITEAHLSYDPEKALEAAKDAATLCDELCDLKAKPLVQRSLAAAKAQIAVSQNAQQAQSLSSRGDQYMPHKWPKSLQQRGARAPDLSAKQYMQEDRREVSRVTQSQGNGVKTVEMGGKAMPVRSTTFARKSFKWTAPHHPTDEAWYRQELRLLAPKA